MQRFQGSILLPLAVPMLACPLWMLGWHAALGSRGEVTVPAAVAHVQPADETSDHQSAATAEAFAAVSP